MQSTSSQQSGAAVGGARTGESRVAIIVLFLLAVAVCLAAALLATFTLPQALDAAASPASVVRDTARTPSAQAPAERIDSLNEKELATWRLRSSD